MNNILRMILIVFICLFVQSCNKNEKEQLILDYKAKEIDFSDYRFTINYQDQIFDRTILFDAKLGDIFKDNGKIYFFLYNEAGYFKLVRSSSITKEISEIDKYHDKFKRNDEVKVVARITEYNFYKLKEDGYEDDGPWFSPSVVCKGELLQMIKN